MARLIAALIRHGDYHQLPDTPSAHQPFPLTDRGFEQADKAAANMAQVLAEQGWVPDYRVDSSRLLRAWQTADRFRAALAPLFVREPEQQGYSALAERGVGSAANLTIDQIEAILEQDPRFDAPPSDWKSNSHYRLPLQGAESLMDAGERVARHIELQMITMEPSDTDRVRLFVGHGAAFRHAAYKLGVLEFDQIAALSMYHAEPVYIEMLEGGRWKHVAGDWKVRGKRDAYVD
ncbi:histidine phosphatase family protein [Marinobacterium sp. YM272]|uniref:histidine phosphatase family protein n=1 Tax=Marinobacterium sp. YM272 TaxID=3421654 RepID=UPI003D7F65DA